MAITNVDVARRLMNKFTAGDGCWMWRASVNDGGYGQLMADGQPRRAHRLMYQLLVGPIPEGLVIDHLCRNRACVNPSHMEPVTRGENVRRGIGGQAAKARMAALTHCKRGHEFTAANTAHNRLASGTLARRCKACRRRGGSDSDC